MTDTTSPVRDDGHRDAPTRDDLWATAAAGLKALPSSPATDGPLPRVALPASSAAGSCAARIATWLRRRERLEDGTTVDRPLVEAFLEAESALLVYSGEAPGRVERARRVFEDVALGALAPALRPVGGR